MTKQEKQQEVPGPLGVILTLVAVNSVFGFLAWAGYMFAIKELTFLPAIGLLTGLSLWALWMFITCVPLTYFVILQYGVNAIATENAMKKSRQEIKDILTQFPPANETNSVGFYSNKPRKDRNDLDA